MEANRKHLEIPDSGRRHGTRHYRASMLSPLSNPVESSVHGIKKILTIQSFLLIYI